MSNNVQLNQQSIRDKWESYFSFADADEYRVESDKIRPGVGAIRKIKSAHDLKEIIKEHIIYCEESGMPLTHNGLAMACGYKTRQAFYGYACMGTVYDDVITFAKTAVESYAERMLYSKHSAGARFSLMNSGWHTNEKHTIESTETEIRIGKKHDDGEEKD